MSPLTRPGRTWLDVAITRVKIATLKDHLSEYLRSVEGGAEVVITDRDRPIARLTPVADPARGLLPLVPPSTPFHLVRDRERAPAGWPVTSTTLLRDERAER